MAKNLLQDVVRKKPGFTPAKRSGVDPGKFKLLPQRPKYTLWSVAFISLLFLFFALTFLFARATIIIEPQVENISLQTTFQAVKGGDSPSLSFDIVRSSFEEAKSVPASGEEDIQEPARGLIILYNNAGSSPQILSRDTRLLGSNGKIYKTKARAIIPGRSAGGALGSVEAEIYASEPGEEYNSPPLDFEIMGFKGTPKYSQIYGRGKGEILGGRNGRYKVVSVAERQAVEAELESTLSVKLSQKTRAEIPAGFILFDGAGFIQISKKETVVPENGENISINIAGVFTGVLLNEEELSKKIAEASWAEYDGREIYIPDIRNLDFELRSGDLKSNSDIKNIDFNLSGEIKIVSKVDFVKLRREVLSQKKKDFPQILVRYPGASGATVRLRPFWKRSFPTEPEDVEIILSAYNK